MTSEDTLRSVDSKMGQAVEALGRNLVHIRTGRAHPDLVENLRVDYYGVPTPLNQIASISTPDARLLVIQPWDRKCLGDIEKAVLKSDLGLNPANDGNVIRLALPQLTEERRKELVRVVRKRVEEGRVAVRNIRREGMDGMQKLKEQKEMSEDDHKRALGHLQKLTDGYIEDINQIGKDKEAELLES
ncbi:ribosome recycling factor [Chloroflexota bacterium]